MQINCIEDFKVEYEKLLKKNYYKDIQEELISYFFDKSIEELCSGVRLNNNEDAPYIKKRLGGSGGYRVYYYALIKDERIYLMFVHPKTGNLGSENITDESKSHLYKKVLECINNKNFYEVSKSIDGKKLQFAKKER